MANQVTRFKRQKEQLLEKANQMSRGSISKDEIAIERNAEILDEIQHTAERELAMTLMTQNWETMTQVKQALQKIEDGSYGICESCEEPINERRLNAIPWAKLCIACQTAQDQEMAPAWKEAA